MSQDDCIHGSLQIISELIMNSMGSDVEGELVYRVCVGGGEGQSGEGGGKGSGGELSIGKQ